MRYIVTGGGTGGHIYPALAIAMEIKSRDPKAEILYVGTEKGLESKLVPKAGFDFKTIRVKGMPRSLNKESFIAFKELLHGLRDANKIIKDFKPDMVIGTGGYVCGPVVYKAAKKGIVTVIHEQNAFPGITNKILSRYVDKIMITFEEARKYFKNKDKVILTGNPIRNTLFEVDKDEAYGIFGLRKDKPVLLSFGGSGGQKSLNESMYHLIKENKNKDLQIVQVTGTRFYDDFMARLKKDGIELSDNIKVLAYAYDMPELLNITDLIITSSGAITLAEIASLGIPSILVPKSYTAENHQEYNAKAFSDKGAALLILEKDLSGEALSREVENLIGNKEVLDNMSSKALEMSSRNSAGEIVDIIDTLI